MQGLRRRLVYVALYEGIAIALTSVGIATMSGQGASKSTALAVISSAIAVVWNMSFNYGFEAWEARQPERYRSTLRRIAYAIGFEGGLTIVLVPLFAWWLDVSWWEALVLDAALLLFFLMYTFAFNLAFDKLFGLPDSVSRGIEQHHL